MQPPVLANPLLNYRHRVNNFSRDVNDGENYTVLLNQLKPENCSLAPLQTRDLRTRAEQVSLGYLAILTAPELAPRFSKMPRPSAAGST